MVNNKPFKIRLNINGEVKSIISMYYKHIDGIPVFSCNSFGSYRIVEVHNNEKIVMIGSDILSHMSEEQISVLIWMLILRYELQLNKCEYSVKDEMYVDKIVAYIFGITSVSDTLKHLVEIIKPAEKQLELFKYRIDYLDNKVIYDFESRDIDVDSILKRINLAQVLEVN